MIIEKALSNRSNCKNCNKKIEKDELRCKVEIGKGMYGVQYKTLCLVCGEANLKRLVKESEEQLKIIRKELNQLQPISPS